MIINRISWTDDKIKNEAEKYSFRGDFKKGSPSAYSAACNRNIMKTICAHMGSVHKKWDAISLYGEALKYKTRKEFEINNRKAYQAANRLCYMDGICCHMTSIVTHRTDSDLLIEALKYNKRSDFVKNNKNAYYVARKRGLINNACNHMHYGISGFNKEKPGIVYYIRFDSIYDSPLYKIGITNLSAKDRIRSMGVNDGITTTILKEIWFEIGKDASDFESMCLKEYSEYRYYGDNILRNGNTELFVCDVLGYDNDCVRSGIVKNILMAYS
jgi:hypothetical protein